MPWSDSGSSEYRWCRWRRAGERARTGLASKEGAGLGATGAGTVCSWTEDEESARGTSGERPERTGKEQEPGESRKARQTFKKDEVQT